MVCVVAIALGLSTYAWFASNNSAKAEKMNVTATADVKFLEIQEAKGTIKKPLSLSPWLPVWGILREKKSHGLCHDFSKEYI